MLLRNHVVGAARGDLGVCLLPSFGGSSPVVQRESEREKRQPQRWGGWPEGVEGRWPSDYPSPPLLNSRAGRRQKQKAARAGVLGTSSR